MKMLSSYPTETIVLHKISGELSEINALFGTEGIIVDDISTPIEKGDFFERELPNGVAEFYEVIKPKFYREMPGIPAYYCVEVERIDAPKKTSLQEQSEKIKVLFISHSTKDKSFTKAFVDMLFSLGMGENQIVCSSYPGVGIPLGENVYEWLVDKFVQYNLHVIFFLSKNYYNSVACLNEMGAAWVMKQKWDGILLPGFDFSDITGCMDAGQIAIKLDGDNEELKHRLGELKDDIITEFQLPKLTETRWEGIRDEFISIAGQIRTPDTMGEGMKGEDTSKLVEEIMTEINNNQWGSFQ